MEKLVTKLGKSYWGETGVYQSVYDRLYKNLVPDSGEAETLHGELVRCISRLYYDYNNNGNMNSMSCETEMEEYTCNNCDGSGETTSYGDDDEEETEPCDDCGGSGELEEEVDGEPFITKFYKSMIDFLYKNLESKKVVSDLERYLLDNYENYNYDDKSMNIYDRVIDEVCYFCMTTENRNLGNVNENRNIKTFESFKNGYKG